MPATPPQMPALGFVGLGQYLDANRGVLGDQYGQAKKKADDTIAAGDLGADENLSRQFGSESALAGNMGGDPTSGANAFNASLAWGAYGPQYKTLSDTLDKAAHPPPAAPAAPAAAPQAATESPAAAPVPGGAGYEGGYSQGSPPNPPPDAGTPNTEGGMPQGGPPSPPGAPSGNDGGGISGLRRVNSGLRNTLRRVGI